MKKLSLTLFSLLFVTGCMFKPNFTSNQSLAPNEGLVLVNCATSNHGNKHLSFYKTGYVRAFGNIQIATLITCPPEGKTSLIKMKADEYYAGWNGHMAKGNEESILPKFTVQANKVNYIGDFRASITGTEKKSNVKVTKVSIIAIDNFSEAQKIFINMMPEISNKYELVSSVARK